MRAFFQNERQPLYIQLKEAIKDEIIKGNLKAGDKIPSEILLQRLYSVSRVTVRKAVNELVKENYLIKLQGKGTYVSQVFVFEGRKGISSFTELCKLQGKATIAVVIKADLERGDVILLCSDGLTNMVSDEQIARTVSGKGSLREKAEYLVETANHNGGRDNITVVLAELEKEVGTC